MIQLDGVSFRSADRFVLNSIDLRIDDGEWVALTGRNGSGKSSLIKIASGLLEPSEGKVFFDKSGPGDVPAAVALQNPDSQFVTVSAEREILFGLENIGLKEPEAEARLDEAMELFNLKGLAGRNPHTLSGGEKQRLLLASVYALRASHIFLDEPFSFLDRESSLALADSVMKLFIENKRAVLWATLNSEEIEMADRVICLEEGELVFSGKPEEFLGSTREGIIVPGELVELLKDVPHAGDSVPGAGDPGGAAGLEGGGPASENETRAAVSIDNAVFSRGEGSFSLAVEGLGVNRGEAVGITGPSGSGKTTLLSACAGLLPPRSGSVEILGRKSVSTKDFQAGKVAFLFQTPEEGFFATSVEEEVALGYRAFGEGKDISRSAEDALGSVGLDYGEFRFRNPSTLSQGEKRLVALASLLVIPAKICLLDEPSLFLDGEARRNLVLVIKSLRDKGMTLIVASHDTELIAALTDRAVTLGSGRPIHA